MHTGDAKLTLELQSGDGELYNLINDKYEMENLWGKPEAAALQAKLNELLLLRPGQELNDFDEPIGVA